MKPNPKGPLTPQNLDAERTLLGSVLVDNEALAVVLECMAKNDLYSEAHRITFEKMTDLADKNRPIDLVTLAEELSKDGLLEKAGGVGYLSSLSDGVPVSTPAAVSEYARIVKEKSLLRRLINTSNNSIAKAFEACEEPSTLIEAQIEDLYELQGDKRQGGFKSLRQIVEEEMQSLGKMFDTNTPISYGVPTAFADLDGMIHGIRPGELVLIAARPSLGKTSLCLNLAMNAAKAKTARVGIFSLEMQRAALLHRLLGMDAKINLHRMLSGFMGREDWQKVTRSLGKLVEFPIWIDDTPSISMTQFRAKAHRLIREHGANLFMLDYLQLMSTTERRYDNRNAEVAAISNGLKQFAKDHNVPVVVLSQLSRESEKGRRRKPRLSDLRDSGALEQDADVVLFLWRGRQDSEDENGEGVVTTVIVGKQRNGPTGEVKLVFLSKFTTFESYAGGHAEEPPPETESLPYKDD